MSDEVLGPLGQIYKQKLQGVCTEAEAVRRLKGFCDSTDLHSMQVSLINTIERLWISGVSQIMQKQNLGFLFKCAEVLDAEYVVWEKIAEAQYSKMRAKVKTKNDCMKALHIWVVMIVDKRRDELTTSSPAPSESDILYSQKHLNVVKDLVEFDRSKSMKGMVCEALSTLVPLKKLYDQTKLQDVDSVWALASQHNDKNVRSLAVEALAQSEDIGKNRGSFLISRASDRSVLVRQALYKALIDTRLRLNINDKEELLIRGLNDRSRVVRQLCMELVEEWTTEEPGIGVLGVVESLVRPRGRSEAAELVIRGALRSSLLGSARLGRRTKQNCVPDAKDLWRMGIPELLTLRIYLQETEDIEMMRDCPLQDALNKLDSISSAQKIDTTRNMTRQVLVIQIIQRCLPEMTELMEKCQAVELRCSVIAAMKDLLLRAPIDDLAESVKGESKDLSYKRVNKEFNRLRLFDSCGLQWSHYWPRLNAVHAAMGLLWRCTRDNKGRRERVPAAEREIIHTVNNLMAAIDCAYSGEGETMLKYCRHLLVLDAFMSLSITENPLCPKFNRFGFYVDKGKKKYYVEGARRGRESFGIERNELYDFFVERVRLRMTLAGIRTRGPRVTFTRTVDRFESLLCQSRDEQTEGEIIGWSLVCEGWIDILQEIRVQRSMKACLKFKASRKPIVRGLGRAVKTFAGTTQVRRVSNLLMDVVTNQRQTTRQVQAKALRALCLFIIKDFEVANVWFYTDEEHKQSVIRTLQGMLEILFISETACSSTVGRGGPRILRGVCSDNEWSLEDKAGLWHVLSALPRKKFCKNFEEYRKCLLTALLDFICKSVPGMAKSAGTTESRLYGCFRAIDKVGRLLLLTGARGRLRGPSSSPAVEDNLTDTKAQKTVWLISHTKRATHKTPITESEVLLDIILHVLLISLYLKSSNFGDRLSVPKLLKRLFFASALVSRPGVAPLATTSGWKLKVVQELSKETLSKAIRYAANKRILRDIEKRISAVLMGKAFNNVPSAGQMVAAYDKLIKGRATICSLSESIEHVMKKDQRLTTYNFRFDDSR
eukprot:GHVQ01042370.1.p1 GENE.GHVQ01042370.1~~GHVQ01042370.1.p1  ORF type:complete len:1055 (-),score=116.34 GHVQ01042370.1:1818-4982(-)